MNRFRSSYRFFFIAIVCALAAGVFLLPAQSIAQTKLVNNVWMPKIGPAYNAFYVKWVEEVEKESNGRIKIEIPSSSLGPPNLQYDLAVTGTADIALMASVYKRNEWSLLSIGEIPFITPTSEAASVALWRTYNKYLAKANEIKGVKILTIYTFGEIVFEFTKKPVYTIDDFKGIKIGCVPGNAKKTVQAVGATPVVAPGMKSFELISKGTVDANLGPLFAAHALKHSRYLSHIMEVPGGMLRVAFVYFMNQDTWDKLSPQDKKIIEKASGEKQARRTSGTSDKFEMGTIKPMFQKDGVEFYKADKALIAEMTKRLASFEKEWLAMAKKKGIDGPAALEFYKKTAAEIGATAK